MSDKPLVYVVEWPDIYYTLRLKLADDDAYNADFELFAMVCVPPSEITYAKKGWTALPSDMTPNLDEATHCASGWIKWDGCTEFETREEGEDGMRKHVCGREGMKRFATALERLYDVAAERLPHWNE